MPLVKKTRSINFLLKMEIIPTQVAFFKKKIKTK
jgi:hypothetical protein